MATRLQQDRVVLRFPELPKASPGGIVLEAKRYYGDDDGRVPRDATVVAVGPGTWTNGRYRRGQWLPPRFKPTELRVGDRVLVDAMRTQLGCMPEWDGERGDFRHVRESDVVGVLEPGTAVGVE